MSVETGQDIPKAVKIVDLAGNTATVSGGKLNTNTTVTANISGAQEVIISATDDSIKIGDGAGNYASVSAGGAIKVDASATTQPVSAASLPLPSGAATGAKQDTGNTSLASIDAKLTNPLPVNGTVTSVLAGLAAFRTEQVTVGTSAVNLIPSPLSNRSAMSMKVVTTNNAIVYVGNSSGVTSSTGYALFNGDSLQLDMTPTGSVWAIASAAGQTVYIIEMGN